MIQHEIRLAAKCSAISVMVRLGLQVPGPGLCIQKPPISCKVSAARDVAIPCQSSNSVFAHARLSANDALALVLAPQPALDGAISVWTGLLYFYNSQPLKQSGIWLSQYGGIQAAVHGYPFSAFKINHCRAVEPS